MKTPTHDKLWTLPGAAEECGIETSTLHGAVRAGNVTSYPTADGKHLVLIADVREYRANPPRRGPKTKRPQ